MGTWSFIVKIAHYETKDDPDLLISYQVLRLQVITVIHKIDCMWGQDSNSAFHKCEVSALSLQL